MEYQILKIQMFQYFSLSYGTDFLLHGYSQNSKVILLLQYLLIHHKQGVSKDTLIDLIYGRKEIDNPANALKLLILYLSIEKWSTNQLKMGPLKRLSPLAS